MAGSSSGGGHEAKRVASRRRDRTRPGIVPDPLARVRAWYDDAAAPGISEPDAAALATAGPDGRTVVRFVLLRGIDERGARFFTNHETRKGRELAADPRAALAVYWQPLERQIRLE